MLLPLVLSNSLLTVQLNFFPIEILSNLLVKLWNASLNYLSTSFMLSILIDSNSQAEPSPFPSWFINMREYFDWKICYSKIVFILLFIFSLMFTFPTFLASISNMSVWPLSNKFTLLSKLVLLLRGIFEVVPFLPTISKVTLESVEASFELPVLTVILYLT